MAQKAVRLIEAEMQPEWPDIRESVTFIKLPPYSPDLNPIEQVWRIYVAKAPHNGFFALQYPRLSRSSEFSLCFMG